MSRGGVFTKLCAMWISPVDAAPYVSVPVGYLYAHWIQPCLLLYCCFWVPTHGYFYLGYSDPQVKSLTFINSAHEIRFLAIITLVHCTPTTAQLKMKHDTPEPFAVKFHDGTILYLPCGLFLKASILRGPHKGFSEFRIPKSFSSLGKTYYHKAS